MSAKSCSETDLARTSDKKGGSRATFDGCDQQTKRLDRKIRSEIQPNFFAVD